jgi:hypothetical protein
MDLERQEKEEREKGNKNKLKDSVSSSLISVAPPLLPSFMILRTHNLHVESPCDLISQPELCVRILIVVFGKHAVMECLRAKQTTLFSGTNLATASTAYQFSVISAILIQHFFPHCSSTSTKQDKNSKTQQTKKPVTNEDDDEDDDEGESTKTQTTSATQCRFFSSSVLTSSHENQLRLGRELCLMIQSHLTQSMIDAEHDIRQLGNNALMMRRITSGAYSRRS